MATPLGGNALELRLHRGEWRRTIDEAGEVVADTHDAQRWPVVNLGDRLIVSPWATARPEVAMVQVAAMRNETACFVGLLAGELPDEPCDVAIQRVSGRVARPAADSAPSTRPRWRAILGA